MINSHEWPYNGCDSTLGEWVSMIISQLEMALAGLSCILGDCKYWNILIVVLVEYTSLSVIYCLLLKRKYILYVSKIVKDTRYIFQHFLIC